jgi:hypothetical protein
MGAAPKNAPVVKYKKPSYRRKVERILREYPILKAAIENERQLEREGLGNLFPSCTPLYEESRAVDIVSISLPQNDMLSSGLPSR